ncbi:MAG: efflux RND transporter permease subunit, partial [Gammaproteobacteria bacterium]
IQASIRHPWWVLALTALVMVVGIMAARVVEKQFFPLTERPELIIESWLPEGSSYAQTEALVDKLDRLLAEEPLVDYWTSYIGTDTPRIFTDLNIEQPTPNMTKTYVAALSGDQREALRVRLQELIAEQLPEARTRISIFSFGPPVGAPVQYRVLGPDVEKLRDYARQVRAVAEAHPLTEDTFINWRGSIKSVRIKLDQARIRRLGLSTELIKRNLAMLVSGTPVTQLRDGDDSIDVVIRLTGEQRGALDELGSLPIQLPDQQSITLDQVAKLELAVEDGIIWRYDRFPAITIGTYMPWTVQPHSIVADLQDQIDKIRASMPLGYHIEEGGNVETNRETDALIAPTLPVILLIIVTLLMFQLRHFGLTLLVVATAPIGFAGATITLLLFNQPMGFAGQIGILALAGIIMRNSVILVDQIRQDIDAGLDRWNAILESTVRRFRPITVTGLAAVLAMGPLTTDPFWGPMAWAMMGGLVVATLLTSFLVPALYVIFFRVKQPA